MNTCSMVMSSQTEELTITCTLAGLEGVSCWWRYISPYLARMRSLVLLELA